MSVPRDTLVKDYVTGNSVVPNARPECVKWRIEEATGDAPGAYTLVLDIDGGPYRGQYRAALDLALYIRVDAPIRICSLHLVETAAKTFLAVDYVATHHSNGPDVHAWQYDVFCLPKEDASGKQRLKSVLKGDLKDLRSVSAPLRTPDSEPYWYVGGNRIYAVTAGTTTTDRTLTWRQYDENAQYFVAVFETAGLGLPERVEEKRLSGKPPDLHKVKAP